MTVRESSSPRPAVGSSAINSRALRWKVRANMMSRCSPGSSVNVSSSTPISRPSSSSTLRATARLSERETRMAFGSLPRTMFSQTLNSGTSANSWGDNSMPPLRAAAPLKAVCGAPSTRTRPRSGRSRPVSMRISVDFPLPFGPMKPCAVPRAIATLTSSSARVMPKDFERRSTATIAFIAVPPALPPSDLAALRAIEQHGAADH